MVQLNVRRSRNWVVLLMLTALLVACGGGPSAGEAVIEPTPTPAAAVVGQAEPAEETTEEVAVEEEAAAQSPAQESAAEAGGMSGTTTYVIDAAQSEVRFTLTELLMGNPTTVVGRGNGIEGNVTINFDDYSQTVISPIVIDSSALSTDNNMRNGQIRRAILQTNNADFQFITFTPTTLNGLPASATVGEPFSFAVTGDLTIRAITQPMTFEVTVTPVSETELRGNATTTLLRSDFDLQIPSVPSVADVSEEVVLEFDFVALAQ